MATNDQTLSMRTASVAFVVSGAVGDPEGIRTVSSIIALLVALGLALVMLAVWLHRVTRPDPEVLAPLEVMGERKWRRSDPVWQRRRLDEIRPSGAVPMEPSIAPPALDAAFDKGPSAPGFDDLHGAGIASEGGGEPIGSDVDELAPPAAGGRAEGEDTPPALKRPADDEFETDGVDPGLLAAAMAELDAELGQDRT